ncbi:MAG TPA: aminotransferase class V-fold PLP-dependent enzyme [Pyrinomonadaceae bacterium]
MRAQFDLARDYIHLGAFYLSSHPRAVRAAIDGHRRALDDNPFLYVANRLFEMPGEIRRVAADYLGGAAEEVALTDSTTTGLALVYHGLPLAAGQEILTTTEEHYSHLESIRYAAERAGASVKKISLFDGSETIDEDRIVERIRTNITRGTRVVGLTWVYSCTGLKTPVRRIAQAVAEVNARRDEAERVLLVVDGVHGLGVEDEAVAQLGCDFFVAGTHKWMFGPRGTGIVWGKSDNWELMRPSIPTFELAPFQAWLRGDAPLPTRAPYLTPGGFHTFEHLWALPAAFEFHKRIGRARIAERTHNLNEQCKEGLARMSHVKLYTPRARNLSAGIICFDVAGRSPEEVAAHLLERRIICSVTPYGISCARVSPSLLNSPEEIETLLTELRALA